MNDEKNYPIKNDKPAVMKDNGPYGTERNKSEDGRYTTGAGADNSEPENQDRYTTNPTAENKTYNDHFRRLRYEHKMSERKEYNPANAAFEENVSAPLFEQALGHYVKAIYGENAFLSKTTEFEDVKLQIDYFVGQKNNKYYLPIEDPEVKCVDIKFLTQSLNDKDFYDHPRLALLAFKSFRGRDHVENKLTHADVKRFDDDGILPDERRDYAFQIPYAGKQRISSFDEVLESKTVIVPSKTMQNLLGDTETKGAKFFETFANRGNTLKASEDYKTFLKENEANIKVLRDDYRKFKMSYDDPESNLTYYYEEDNRTGSTSCRIEISLDKIMETEEATIYPYKKKR